MQWPCVPTPQCCGCHPHTAVLLCSQCHQISWKVTCIITPGTATKLANEWLQMTVFVTLNRWPSTAELHKWKWAQGSMTVKQLSCQSGSLYITCHLKWASINTSAISHRSGMTCHMCQVYRLATCHIWHATLMWKLSVSCIYAWCHETDFNNNQTPPHKLTNGCLTDLQRGGSCVSLPGSLAGQQCLDWSLGGCQCGFSADRYEALPAIL